MAGSRSSGESERRGEEDGRRVIRFEDGDLENPNNCKSTYSVLIWECELMCGCDVGSRVWQ